MFAVTAGWRRLPRLLLFLLALPLAAQSAGDALRRAVAAHQAGDLPRAVENYRECLKQDPANRTALTNLGAALAAQGRYSEAITVYRTGLKLAPGDPNLTLNFALALYKSGAIRDAALELARLRARVPSNPQATLLLADCWLQMGENAKVIELLTPLNLSQPNDLGVAYMLGTALLREKKFDLGQRVLDPIFRRGDSAEARLLMGVMKMQQADFPAALVDFNRGVELNPKLPSLNAYQGQALMETGDTAAAAKAFERELAINPNDFEANLKLGVLLKLDQHYAEALKALDRALVIRPGDYGVRYQQGVIALQQGRVEDARKTFETLVKDVPQFTEAHVTLAQVYYRLKRKADGDRERAIVTKLQAEAQAREAKAPGEAGER